MKWKFAFCKLIGKWRKAASFMFRYENSQLGLYIKLEMARGEDLLGFFNLISLAADIQHPERGCRQVTPLDSVSQEGSLQVFK